MMTKSKSRKRDLDNRFFASCKHNLIVPFSQKNGTCLSSGSYLQFVAIGIVEMCVKIQNALTLRRSLEMSNIMLCLEIEILIQ